MGAIRGVAILGELMAAGERILTRAAQIRHPFARLSTATPCADFPALPAGACID